MTVTNANEAPVIASDGGGASATKIVAENTTAVAGRWFLNRHSDPGRDGPQGNI